jgi:hypothetical protein
MISTGIAVAQSAHYGKRIELPTLRLVRYWKGLLPRFLAAS